MPETQFSFELKGIASVLKDRRLAVPVHQRSFEWKDAQVNEFIEDINGALQRNEEYFLGTIVTISNADPASVLDGQQRLATVALLVAAIADMFSACGDDQRAEQTRTQYLMPFDIDSGDTTTQLRLNQTDEPYFRSLLRTGYAEPGAGSPDSHRRLHKARELLKAWLQRMSERQDDRIRWLTTLTRFIRESAKVLVVDVPDDANAFLIFETLNDRGLDLSIADLVKNYLLGRASEDIAIVLSQWSGSMAALAAYGGENAFNTFLRHYWSSKYNVVREKELYRDIKQRITSRTNAVELAEDLSKNAQLYAAILSPEHEYWGDTTEQTRDGVRTLIFLGLEQYRPLLLAALAYFTTPDVSELVKMLISWNVRLLVVGGLGGGVMEARYSELGRAIRSGETKNSAELAQRAREFIPADAVFKDSFTVGRVSKAPLARYYLSELEKAAAGGQLAETIPNPRLTLEHVLPQKPLDNWPQFTADEADAYVHRIGNLTLLTHPLNSNLRSASFAQKRPVYAESVLVLTKNISGRTAWTITEIETRQQQLAERAVRVWPLR